MTLWQFIQTGGIFMIPLVISSIIAVGLIIERGVALQHNKVVPERIENAVDSVQPGDDFSLVSHLCERDPSPLARIIQTAFRHVHWPKSENLEAVQTRARHEITSLEKGLVVLEILTGVAPLLGLLGTIWGVATAFSGFAQTDLTVQSAKLSAGIAEALHATVGGLVVAIPCLVFHSYYSRKIEVMATTMESVCSDLLAKIYSENSPVLQEDAQIDQEMESPSELYDPADETTGTAHNEASAHPDTGDNSQVQPSDPMDYSEENRPGARTRPKKQRRQRTGPSSGNASDESMGNEPETIV